MQLLILQDYEQVTKWIATYISHKINVHNTVNNDPFVIGLPTGASPLGVYMHLIDLNKEGKVSFKNVITFNMDEYIGLPEDNPQSYHYYLWNNLFNQIDIPKENVNILNGNAKDVALECENYELKIKNYGGIDLFLGGVGVDGHLAFNMPGSSLKSKTRVKTLNLDTRIANSRYFHDNPDMVPKFALTVGVRTIMEAREVIIIANGYTKARALRSAVEDGINHMWPVSALQLHPKCIIVCDEPATNELKVSTYRYFKDIDGGLLNEFSTNM